jgi:type IV secretory pathway TraG/TraD family ATPase VirD4
VSRGESFGFSDFTFSESESYTESTSYKDRELQTVDELRMLSPEQVIIFASELPPILGNRLKYFEAPSLASLAAWQAPPIKALPEVQLPAHLLPKEEPKPKRVPKPKPKAEPEKEQKDEGDSDYFDIG